MFKSRNIPKRIKDKWVFYFLCPVVAVLVVHTGNENTLPELLVIPSYYTDMLLSFALTYATAFYIKRITGRVLISVSNPVLKLALYAVVIPTIVLVGIEVIYLLALLHIPLKESSVFFLELPLIVIFCVLLTLVFVLLYSKVAHPQNNDKTDSNPGFMVHKGNQSFLVEQEDIAYIMSSNHNTFIVHRNAEQFLVSGSLKVLEQQLSSRFFRLNRQIICNRSCVVSFQKLETRKLNVILDPQPDFSVFVSKTNAAAFQSWFKQT